VYIPRHAFDIVVVRVDANTAKEGVELHSHSIAFGFGLDGDENKVKANGGICLAVSADIHCEVGVEAGDVAGGAVPDLDGGGVEGSAHRVV